MTYQVKSSDVEILKQIKEVKIISSNNISNLNKHLESGEWFIISVASGVDETNYPITYYSIGFIPA